MKVVVDKILGYLEKKDAIDASNEEELAFYRYGVEITLSSITNIIVIVLISLLSNNIIEGLLFLVVFIPTRQFTGGFHADTYLKCNLTFGTTYIVVLLMYRFIAQYMSLTTTVILLITEILFVINFCPIENVNKPIDEKDKKGHRIKAVLMFVLYGGFGLGLIINNLALGNLVLFTLHLIVVLGITGILKERRRHYEKQDG